MILVAVEATFSDDTIAGALETVDARSAETRAMPGCVGYRGYMSGEALCIVQHWQDADAFEAYRNSAVFADLGAALKPMMAAPPVTQVATVVDG